MASQMDISILVQVKDEATAAFGKIKRNLEGLGTSMAAVGAGIVTGLGAAVKAAAEAEVSQSRFETVLKDVAHASDEQVAALREQQAALQAVTRFDGDAIASAQAFLGTFALTSNQIGSLTPKLLDMAEGMRKATGGTIDLEGASNMLGKAIATGSLGALVKVGITVPGTTKAMQELFLKNFELANQQERVAMTAQLVDANFKGLGESAGKTLAGQVDILKNSFGDLMENIGSVLMPILSQMIERIGPVIKSITDWMAVNPQLTQDIILVAAALGPLLIILPALVAAIAAITSPIGLVIIAITALVAAGVFLYRHWDEVKAKASDIWTAVSELFQAKMDEVKGALGVVRDFFKSVWKNIVDAFQFSINLIVGILDIFLSGFDKDWKEHFMAVLALFKQVWANMKVAFDLFVNTLLPILAQFLADIMTAVNEFAEPILNAFSTIWNSIKENTTVAWENIKNIVKAAANWIIDRVNSVIAAINAVASAGAKVTGSSAPQIPSIPRLAEGGIVNRPTLAMIGEAGPEAVIPLSRAAGVGGIGGGVTINLNVGNLWGGNPQQAAREIGDLIIKQLQLNARVG